jgi:glycosyltransferase involved in cell wall biosynthesis
MTGGDRERAKGIVGHRGIPVTELARGLVDAGVEVEIATIAEEVETPMTLQGDRLRLHIAPMRTRHRARNGFRQERDWLEGLIRASEANVVHAHWTYEFAWAALDSGRPAIVTAHDAPLTGLRYYPDPYRAVRAIMAYIVRIRVQNLTAVSPYLASAWRRQTLYRDEIPVVPNAVACEAGTPDRTKRDDPAPVILDVSEDGPGKNIPSLLHAMSFIRVHHPKARLRLIGRGLSEDSAFADIVHSLELEDAVDLVGELEFAALTDEYSKATVFVHSSLNESFGLTIAEAMSHGLPVVAGARAGGPPWLLDEGQAGLLVDCRRPEAIGGAVCRLLDDSDLRAELGAIAAERVRTTFSSAAVTPIWTDLYERATRQCR